LKNNHFKSNKYFPVPAIVNMPIFRSYDC